MATRSPELPARPRAPFAGRPAPLPLPMSMLMSMLLALLLSLLPPPSHAQADAPPPAQPSAEECALTYPPDVKVTSVTPLGYRDVQHALDPGSKVADQEPAELRHGLRIGVHNLAALSRLQRCPADKPRQLVLFLAGRPLPGLTAYPPTDPSANTIIYRLERKPEALQEWTEILGRPGMRPVSLPVSIGFDGTFPIPSGHAVRFQAIPYPWLAGWLLLIGAFAWLVLRAGRTTNMLRDSGNVAGGGPAAFSLARIQLAFWTFMVLGSFAFIGMVTGDYLHSMNEKVLILMGLSIGTSLGSAVIDQGSSGMNPRTAMATGGSWWRDILSDGRDISVHRFQMVAWTIALGVVFLHEVYNTLAMPEFDAPLLALMGISSGTYLGLKITSEAKPAQPPDAVQ